MHETVTTQWPQYGTTRSDMLPNVVYASAIVPGTGNTALTGFKFSWPFHFMDLTREHAYRDRQLWISANAAQEKFGTSLHSHYIVFLKPRHSHVLV